MSAAHPQFDHGSNAEPTAVHHPEGDTPNRTDALYELIHGHGRRVALMTYTICRALGANETWSGAVARCAVHHDIGKLQVSAQHLLHPGLLECAGRLEVRRHAMLGAQMIHALLAKDTALAGVQAGVCRHHHERWDGTGYPDRLAAADIPLAARIVAVADVFDALTTPRPYRRPVSPAEAIACIVAQSGTHFDPDVVEAFESLSGSGQRGVGSFAPSRREEVEDRWLYRMAAAASPTPSPDQSTH